MIAHISQYGKPVICGADVTPTPASVADIATTFGAHLHSLESTLTKERKQDLTAAYDNGINSHERDALCAAIIAYRSLKPLYTKICERVDSCIAQASKEQKESVLSQVLYTDCNIDEAMQRLFDQDTEESETDNTPSQKTEAAQENTTADNHEQLRQTITQQNARIAHLQEYVTMLKDQLATERKKTQGNAPDISQYKKEIDTLRKTIAEKEKRIAQQQDALELIERGWLLVKKISRAEELKTTNNAIVCVNGKLPTQHISSAVQHIITDAQIDAIPTTSLKTLQYQDLGNYILISPDTRTPLMTQSATRFTQWLHKYKSQRQTDSEVPYGTVNQ